MADRYSEKQKRAAENYGLMHGIPGKTYTGREVISMLESAFLAGSLSGESVSEKVRNYMYKKQAHLERHKRMKETGSDKYSEFRHGEAWGNLKACQTLLGIIAQEVCDE